MVESDDGPVTALTRGGGLAAWRQIADRLGQEIEVGALAAGAQLPTESALAARYGVNRHTVRRALAVLGERGLVRAAQGRGTFVEAGPIPYPVGRRTRFSENISRAGREAWGELIAATTRPADPETAEALRIAPGSPILEARTRHRADGVPISTARTRFPLPRFEGFDGVYAELGSITRAFARFGLDDYARLSTRVGARLVAAEEAALLDLAPGRPVIVLASVNVDAAGVPIQATSSVFAADRVELMVET